LFVKSAVGHSRTRGIAALRARYPIALTVALAAVPMSAASRTLEVGPGKEFTLPSQAAVAARDGDIVRIGPGNYVDCAIWSQNNLTIEAMGDGVVLSDKSCDGKAIFVITGDDVTIRGITFRGAAVPDNNGAGIRAQGGNLTVENSAFLENQMGMLATGSRTGVVVIRDSLFARNGTCYPHCPNDVNMHALYVGLPMALLRVERTEFAEQHDGHYVKSRAQRSEIFDNVIHDGEQGTGSYLIDIPDGGSLIAHGNRLEKGPHSENRTAIAIGEEHQSYNAPEILIENNTFNSLERLPAIFVWNFTKTTPVLRENRIEGRVTPLVAGRR
jgi:hypothetical protein